MNMNHTPQMQVPRAEPRAEKDWDYSSALSASSAIKLAPHTTILSLPTVVSQHLPPKSQAQEIRWSTQIFCTANFVETVDLPPGSATPCFSDYLRPLFALLLFPEDGTVCLISEWEANALQQLAWRYSSSTNPPGGPLLLLFSHTRLNFYADLPPSLASR
jgi:hypothetical protein